MKTVSDRPGDFSAKPNAPIPCPRWCTAEHDPSGYDSTDWHDSNIRYRTHVRSFADQRVGIVQDERHEGGRVIIEAPVVRIYAERCESTGLAREIAAGLYEAASMIETAEAAR